MREDKWKKRDKKRDRRHNGHREDGRSVKLILEVIIKKSNKKPRK